MFQDDWLSGLKEIIKETQEFISVKYDDLTMPYQVSWNLRTEFPSLQMNLRALKQSIHAEMNKRQF